MRIEVEGDSPGLGQKDKGDSPGLSQQDKKADDTLTPQVYILSSGEMTPFDLKISSRDSDDYYRLNGSETGELSLNHVTP